MLAFDAVKLQPQRVFQRRADRSQRRQPGQLNPVLGIAGIRRQKPGHIFRGRQRRGGQQDALQVFGELFFQHGGNAGRRQRPERGFRRSQRERLQGHFLAVFIPPDQQKIAQVGDQHLPVLLPVFIHLVARRNFADIFAGSLDFQHAPARRLSRPESRFSGLCKLVRRKKPAVGNACARVFEIDNAPDIRLECLAGSVKQAADRRIIRGFFDARPGGADCSEFRQISLKKIHGSNSLFL